MNWNHLFSERQGFFPVNQSFNMISASLIFPYFHFFGRKVYPTLVKQLISI